MNTITVSASKSYDVIIAYDLLPQLGKYVAEIKPTAKIAIISDSNVWSLYEWKILKALADYEVISYVLPAGEESKSGENYLRILNFLAENGITRSDLLIALGGGVVGDMTGFVAATYLRGISYIQVPTSLLAMVDASVGGKTAIDLPAGKNLTGAFYQPSLVLCDICSLNTLPKEVFTDGCAEVIKYGILYDEALFSHLTHYGLTFDREYVISRCVELKRNVVMEDEFDTGARQKLNLGHTIGHSIEKSSRFTLSHGQAVAIGIAMITKAAVAYNHCDKALYDTICDVLKLFGLPTETDYSADAVFNGAITDKKRFGGNVNLILPRAIGDCFIQSTSLEELRAYIKAGL